MNEMRQSIKRMAICQPNWAEELLKKAEMEYRGEQILPGTQSKPIFVGVPPRWKEQKVTDNEYLWCLNRMYQWNDFVAATCITDDIKYAVRIREELLDWIDQCPPPPIVYKMKEISASFNSVTPWRTLEAGIRMFEVWPHALSLLEVEGLLNQQEKEIVKKSFYEHGLVLRSIPPLLWPEANHNHYLMENLGLLYICHLFPEFESSSEWFSHAHKQILRCVKAQISDEGAQIEGCPAYHNLCMDFFCLWLILCKKSGLEVPEDIKKKIRKGLDYSMASFRPQGGGVPWGDSDADYSAVKSAMLGYRAFHDARWLACLKGLLGIDRLERECAVCILESGSLDIHTILQNMSFEASNSDLSRISFQKEINQVSYRTSWKPDAFHIQFGCQIPGDNGHAHIDPLSFDFSALGKNLLADPGRYTYDEANDRKLFKSVEMHNCLLIDSCSPYEYISSWKFGRQHDGCLIKAEEKNNCFWAQGIHTCYFPVICQRVVCIVKERCLVVWDRLEHLNGNHNIQIYFHVDTEKLYPGDVPGSFYTQRREEANTAIFSLSELPAKLLPGFISEEMDIRRPSVRICYEDSCASGTENYLTVIVPFTGKRPVVRAKGFYEEAGYICAEISMSGCSFSLKWNGGEDWKIETLK